MIRELENRLNELKESRKNVDYALDMLEAGVGYTPYSDIMKEIELLTELNNAIARDVLEMVDDQEKFDVTIEAVLSVVLGK